MIFIDIFDKNMSSSCTTCNGIKLINRESTSFVKISIWIFLNICLLSVQYHKKMRGYNNNHCLSHMHGC